MSTDFHCYVSHGSADKLESYCKCKSPGTVVIYKYTTGEKSGTVVMVQITKHQTLESARSIVLSHANKKSLLTQIKSINYRRN